MGHHHHGHPFVRQLHHELQGVPGRGGSPEGLTEDQLSVQLAHGFIRIRNEAQVFLTGGTALQAAFHQSFGEGVHGGVFGGGAVLELLDQFFRETQGQLAQHGYLLADMAGCCHAG